MDSPDSDAELELSVKDSRDSDTAIELRHTLRISRSQYPELYRELKPLGRKARSARMIGLALMGLGIESSISAKKTNTPKTSDITALPSQKEEVLSGQPSEAASGLLNNFEMGF